MDSLTTKAIENLGELLLIGIPGLECAPSTASFLKEARIGGVILFSHNYESPNQVHALIKSIQDLQREPRWIAVDQEGGRVQRFKKGLTRYPDAFTLASKLGPTGVFEVASLMARELFALGVNLNFAPVADLWNDPKNKIIGDRAYGEDPEQVAACVSALIRAHKSAHVQPCAKHFPGHGATVVDSHLALPTVHHKRSALESKEWIPFREAILADVGMIMTAHLLIPDIDSEYPSTLSPKTLMGVLRQALKYKGVIVSDDLEMQGITDHYGPDEAPVLAVLAGCDLLIYRSEKEAIHAYQALTKAVKSGRLPAERVLEASSSLRQLKASSFEGVPTRPLARQLDAYLKELDGREKLKQLLETNT